MLLDATINEIDVKLLNIYAPNLEETQVLFYNFLRKFIAKHANCSDRILLGGDLNFIMDPTLDSVGECLAETSKRKKILSEIQDRLSEFDLHDYWRLKHPDKKDIHGDRKHHRSTVDWITG